SARLNEASKPSQARDFWQIRFTRDSFLPRQFCVAAQTGHLSGATADTCYELRQIEHALVRRRMRALQFQYFFSYGIIGSIAPLLTVFLKDDKGLSPPQVGMALAMVSSSTLITPLLITLLADTKLQT